MSFHTYDLNLRKLRRYANIGNFIKYGKKYQTKDKLKSLKIKR